MADMLAVLMVVQKVAWKVDLLVASTVDVMVDLKVALMAV